MGMDGLRSDVHWLEAAFDSLAEGPVDVSLETAVKVLVQVFTVVETRSRPLSRLSEARQRSRITVSM